MKNSLSQLKNKLIIFSLIFVILLTIHFLSLNFYYKNLKQRIEKVNFQKQKILEAQLQQQQQIKIKQLANLLNQKLGFNYETLLPNFQQKIDWNFEGIKNLILNKIREEGWMIINTNFDPRGDILNLSLEIPKEDYRKFEDFMIKELLLLKLDNLTINKKEDTYLINLILRRK